MIDPALGAARLRIRRIRWTTTLVFAATTALCLAALVVIALRVDSSARVTAFDVGLRQQVGSLSELVSYADGDLDLGRLDASQIEQTTPVLGVVTRRSIVYAEPSQEALPADAELRAMLAGQRTSPSVASAVVPPASVLPGRGRYEGPYHWAYAPVLDPAGPSVDAVVLVGGPVPGGAAHAELRTRLLVTAGALVVVATLLGHVISGRAMRPAVRGLAAQERFLVDAAHELRTPLSVLGVVADHAARHPDDLEAQVAATRRVRRQVHRLTGLTDGLLLRARAAVGTTDLSLEPVRLDQLVEQVVAELAEGDRATGPGPVDPGLGPDPDPAIVVRSRPTVVEANAEVVAHAVRNLVENAGRHGQPPVLVDVRDGRVVVDDAGRGIAPRDRRRSLRPGITDGGRADGTGSGLSIAAWAARVHGGALTLGTSDAGGLRATLTLVSSSSHEPSGRLEA